MLNIVFTPKAWEHMQKLEKENKKIYQKAKQLITETARNPQDRGIGKAEKLKGELSGFYSKRIDKEHRLIYSYNEGELVIVACFGHY